MANQIPPTITPNHRAGLGNHSEANLVSSQLDLQSEVNRLTQEIKRLNQMIADQSAELDSFRKASQAWQWPSDGGNIRRYAQKNGTAPGCVY